MFTSKRKTIGRCFWNNQTYKTSNFLQTHHSGRVSCNMQHKVGAEIWKGPIKSFCTRCISCTFKSGKMGAKTEPPTCDIGINVNTVTNGTSDNQKVHQGRYAL